MYPFSMVQKNTARISEMRELEVNQ